MNFEININNKVYDAAASLPSTERNSMWFDIDIPVDTTQDERQELNQKLKTINAKLLNSDVPISYGKRKKAPARASYYSIKGNVDVQTAALNLLGVTNQEIEKAKNQLEKQREEEIK